jgi:hypothetical protein
MEFKLKNPQRTEARKQFLHTVFTTAMEGGINYWADIEQYHWGTDGGAKVVDDLDDFYAVVEPPEAEGEWGVSEAFVAEEGKTQPITETQSLRIDLNVVERGANMLVGKILEGEFNSDYLRQFVVAWLTNGDDGDYDSTGADLVVQLGLFGEEVYA